MDFSRQRVKGNEAALMDTSRAPAEYWCPMERQYRGGGSLVRLRHKVYHAMKVRECKLWWWGRWLGGGGGGGVEDFQWLRLRLYSEGSGMVGSLSLYRGFGFRNYHLISLYGGGKVDFLCFYFRFLSLIFDSYFQHYLAAASLRKNVALSLFWVLTCSYEAGGKFFFFFVFLGDVNWLTSLGTPFVLLSAGGFTF